MDDLVKMTHPSGLTAEVPASAVGQHSMGGWLVDESQTPPDCPACGRPWPTVSPPPQGAEQQDQAPAESGASSSEPPRRRKTSRESDV